MKSILLYGAGTWRNTVNTTNKIQTFINTCLRRILQIRWPNTINNTALWKSTNQKPADEDILQWCWRWTGHTLRKPGSNTTRQSLKWNPQGKRRRGRPRHTWQRDLEADAKKLGYTWGQPETLAQDPDAWRTLVSGLNPRQGSRL